MAAKIKKGDMVIIMAGKDKGERGMVLRVLTRSNKAIVEERNMIRKHQKAAQNKEAGIISKEAPLHLSNIMLIDPSDDKPCRVGFEVREGHKTRVSKRTGAVLD